MKLLHTLFLTLFLLAVMSVQAQNWDIHKLCAANSMLRDYVFSPDFETNKEAGNKALELAYDEFNSIENKDILKYGDYKLYWAEFQALQFLIDQNPDSAWHYGWKAFKWVFSADEFDFYQEVGNWCNTDCFELVRLLVKIESQQSKQVELTLTETLTQYNQKEKPDIKSVLAQIGDGPVEGVKAAAIYTFFMIKLIESGESKIKPEGSSAMLYKLYKGEIDQRQYPSILRSIRFQRPAGTKTDTLKALYEEYRKAYLPEMYGYPPAASLSAIQRLDDKELMDLLSKKTVKRLYKKHQSEKGKHTSELDRLIASYSSLVFENEDRDGDKVPDVYDIEPDTPEGMLVTPVGNSRSAPTFPEFPPTPSQWQAFQLPNDRVKTLKDANTYITDAIMKAGYTPGKFGYFVYEQNQSADPFGFAMACRMEQVFSDGRPRPLPDRWNISVTTKSRFRIVNWLNSLFFANPGYYRVVVFVVTNHPNFKFNNSQEGVSFEQASGFVQDAMVTFPRNLDKEPYTKDHSCYVLVYEFRKPDAGLPAEFVPGEKAAQHLEKTGISNILGN